MITAPSLGTKIVFQATQKGSGGKIPIPLAQFTAGRWLILKGPHPVRTQAQIAAAILNAPGTDGRVFVEKDASVVAGRYLVRARLKADSTHDFYSEWDEMIVTD